MLYIFGGYTKNGFKNDIMQLNLDTYELTQLTTDFEVPLSRKFSALQSLGNTMLLFGGE